ncbi:acyl-CoA carboxylase subunit epsilon [Nocardioides rubriscoriae]|uniref:acyl-CoA carboxylase subunit epsilon n=1 Tax=Nocardioides rubriscoriae TaxID=642762 RepID=UPI0011E03B62|nr:acyl-CoA carboxylase subunit epsilon [Nocardioides rubriscoriae]
MTADEPTHEPARPMLRIVDGNATPEEVAAIVAVLASLDGGDAPAAPRRRPQWGAPHRAVRRPVAHGPGGWRASSLP